MAMLPPLLLRNKHGKPTRPFKAYPRDPLSLPLGFYSPLVPSSDNLLNVLASSNDDFSKQFRKRIQQAQDRLINRGKDSPIKNSTQQSQEKIHSPSSTTNNIPPKKRYRPNTPPPEISSSNLSQPINQETETKDDAYWERRRKNNEAAKRSRDARRAKEDEIALR
jgi:bZIP factor